MKYRNHKIVVEGISFDSKKEAQRYAELRLLERAGKIQNLRLQVPFELLPNQYDDKKLIERKVKYVADFVYETDGMTVVEDTKGVRTKDYIIKRKLMLLAYGIKIQEV